MRNMDVNITHFDVYTVNTINCFSFTGGKPPKTGKSPFVQDRSFIIIYKPAA